VKAADAHTFTKQAKKVTQTFGNFFWDRKGVLMVEFMQQGTILMPEVYCKGKKKVMSLCLTN
jgi:hypothetical protein